MTLRTVPAPSLREANRQLMAALAWEGVPFYTSLHCAMCRSCRVGADGVYIAPGFEFCLACALRVAEAIRIATNRPAVGLAT